MRRLLPVLALCAAAWAQPVVAPTPERTRPERGQDAAGYNVVQSFETGYRFRAIEGNEGKYRSDVNFGNGVRLLSSYLTVNSKNGKGRIFDELVLSTQGLGNDPYQSAILRLQRNRWYRYDLAWRSSEYYNPALTLAAGQHGIFTTRRMQDHDLVLRPQSRLRILAGYSRNRQDGPSFSSLQFPDSRGDEFAYLWDIRRTRNEYRLGIELEIAGTRIHVLRGWESFRDDTRSAFSVPGAGFNPNDSVTLTGFRRDEPYHGSSPYWRVGVHNESLQAFTVDGRFTHTAGRRNFLADEYAQGTGRFGAEQNRQVFVSGNARRPVTTGNLTVSLLPGERITLTNHTAVYVTRMEGDGTYGELNNALAGSQIFHFEFLGIRTIANLSDVSVRLSRWLGLYGGYHFSERTVQSGQVEDLAPPSRADRFTQTNQVHAGVAGIRLQPFKELRVSLDGDLGRANRPFYTTSDKDYHSFGARAQWKSKQWNLLAKYQSNYNLNSNSLFVHSARGRVASLDGTWQLHPALSIEGGYSLLHRDTVTGLAYFASRGLVETDRSLYRSRLHQLRLGVNARIAKRADLYAGYHRVQDRAAGDSGYLTYAPTLPVFFAAQAFPLTYETPLARLSIELHRKLRWNLGLQYYNYREKVLALQNYRANTGYTSLSWSF